MAAKDADIKSQDSAYRRGMVFGLTMAEITLLILFALLLALGAALAGREAIIKAKDQRIATLEVLEREIAALRRERGNAGITITDIVQRLERQQNRIAALEREVRRLTPMEAAAKALEDIIRAISPAAGGPMSPEELIVKLEEHERLRKEAAALQKEVERLKPFEAARTALKDIVQELQRRGDIDATPEKVAELLQQAQGAAKENENLRGQIAQLSRQSVGRGGNEFPSCWATPEGKTESIFELVISTGGIEVRDRNLGHRVEEKAKLPLSAVQYNVSLTLAEFRGQVRPVYAWSVENHCRFYVIIYSAVSSAPIELVNAVNSFFYPDSRIMPLPARRE